VNPGGVHRNRVLRRHDDRVQRSRLEGVIEFTPARFADDRGHLSEVFNAERFQTLGLPVLFAQENESRSIAAGTVRGLHLQVGAHAQGKLVRCVSGSIVDVAVDLRRSSPTFTDHVAVRLDAQDGAQLWIPPGFAHGFCTLEPHTVVQYKLTTQWVPSAERSLRWNDPSLGIEWPVGPEAAILSQKDREAPTLAEFGEDAEVFS